MVLSTIRITIVIWAAGMAPLFEHNTTLARLSTDRLCHSRHADSMVILQRPKRSLITLIPLYLAWVAEYGLAKLGQLTLVSFWVRSFRFNFRMLNGPRKTETNMKIYIFGDHLPMRVLHV